MVALMVFSEVGDVSQAAHALGVSQPALSFQLKRIQEAFPYPLFAVSGKRKVLTAAGMQIAAEVKKQFLQWEDQKRALALRLAKIEEQHLRFAGRRELLLPLLGFDAPCKIDWVVTSSQDAVQGLRRHEFDLAVSARTEGTEDCVAKLFFESGLKLIVPRRWKVPRSSGWKLEDCLDLPVVAYGPQASYLGQVLEECGQKQNRVKIARSVEDWFSVVQMVHFGLGWAVIPESWGVLNAQVHEVPLATKTARQKIFLYVRKEDRKLAWFRQLEASLNSLRPEVL